MLYLVLAPSPRLCAFAGEAECLLESERKGRCLDQILLLVVDTIAPACVAVFAQKRQASTRELRDAGTAKIMSGLGCASSLAARDDGVGQGAGPEPG